MVLVRMRVDELAGAWVGDGDTPFQFGLLGVFDGGPWLPPGGSADCAGIPPIWSALELNAPRWPDWCSSMIGISVDTWSRSSRVGWRCSASVELS